MSNPTAVTNRRFNPSEQRGAVVPITILVIGVLFLAAALTIDIGRVTAKHRDLQSVADIAAIDSVRVMDGQAASLQQATVETAAEESALRNGFGAGTTDTLIVELGVIDSSGNFVVSAPTDIPNAVRIEPHQNLDFMFIAGGRDVNRDALASREAMAGFTIGSFVASLDASTVPLLNDTLGTQLGGPVALDLISYQGLANGSVSLASLTAAAGAGSPSTLLTTDLTAAQLFDIMALALNSQGDVDSLAAVGPLTVLEAASTVSGTVRLADILGIDVADANRLANARFGVGDIVKGTASVVDETNLINLNASVSALGLVNTTAKLTVIEAPQSVIGPVGSTASTSQVRLYVQSQVNVLGLGMVTVPISIDVAPATGTITSISCSADGSAGSVGITVDPSLARVRIGQLTDAQLMSGAAPTTATLVNVLGLVRVTGSSNTTIDSTTELATFTPVYSNTNTIQVGSAGFNSALVRSDLAINVNALGLLGLGFNANTSLLPAVDSILASLTPLIDDIVAVNGLTIGGADVTTFYGDCQAPVLRG